MIFRPFLRFDTGCAPAQMEQLLRANRGEP